MCDSFVVRDRFTSIGNTLFAKNSDREVNEAQHLELLPARRYQPSERVRLTHIEIEQVPQTCAVLLSKPHWLWGAEMGANEHGLVIANEALFTKIPTEKEDGIIGMDLLRLALERACNVDQAIEVITSLLMEYGQAGNCGYSEFITYDNSFLIADGKSALVLETAGREWVIRPVEDSYSISNAITIDTDYQKSSSSLEKTAKHHGFWDSSQSLSFKEAFEDKSLFTAGDDRRCHTMDLLNPYAGEMNAGHAFRVLRDHDKAEDGQQRGRQLCMHSQTADNFFYITTASMVSSLQGNKRVHWVTATSRPCISVFKPIIMEAGLPDHGPMPGSDQEDASSLWWRHERLSRFLLNQPEENSGLITYISERDALETEFLQVIDECPAPTNDQSKQDCHKAVTLCWDKALEFERRWYALCD